MRTNTIQWLSLLLFIASITFSCGTQSDQVVEPFIVSGIVSSGAGTPLEGVTVNTVVDTVITNVDGEYAIEAFPTGPIEYQKEGFELWTELIRERNVINVSLLEESNGAGTRYLTKSVSTVCDNGSTIQVQIVEVSDFGEGTGTITWTKDKVWVLKNRVFVNAGQILTIEPGTIVKSEAGQAESAVALVVARGGIILAEGTVDAPIIFTAASDPIVNDVNGNFCNGTDLTRDDRSLWGGVVILGKSTLNTNTGEEEIEGFMDSFGRGLYGGNVESDNSGILRYVSIRHGGTQVTVNNEINGLTMGGVGSGTIIAFVETYANEDDGFEWFGGTVNTRYLLSAHNSDDAFDYDEGWRGNNQFWLAYQDETAEFAGEHDGGTDPITGFPLANPTIANATFFGAGAANLGKLMLFRDNAAGAYYNSVFTNYSTGVEVEFLGNNTQDAYQNFADGLLNFGNNIFFNIDNEPVFTITNQSALPDDNLFVQQARSNMADYFADPANGNQIIDPALSELLVPLSGSPASVGAATLTDEFFNPVNYRGCFEPGVTRWMEGWTRLSDDF